MKVLRHDRYWSSQLVQLLYQRGVQLRWSDPRAAWMQARHLPQLVRLIRVGSVEGAFASRHEQTSWEVQTLALSGELASFLDQGLEAAACLQAAEEIVRTNKISVAAASAFYCGRGVHALKLSDGKRALEDLTRSVELLRQYDPSSPALVRALYLRSQIDTATPRVDLAEALAYCSPHKKSGRLPTWRICEDLLQKLHTKRGVFEEYETILAWLSAAKKGWARQCHKRYRGLLVWLEGVTLSWLGYNRLATQRLSRAWLTFSDLGCAKAIALLGLDLASILQAHEEGDLADSILRECGERILRCSGDRQLVQMLDQARKKQANPAEVWRSVFPLP